MWESGAKSELSEYTTAALLAPTDASRHQVSLYGFGKAEGVQHHYHDTVHSVEYSKRKWRFASACPGSLALPSVRGVKESIGDENDSEAASPYLTSLHLSGCCVWCDADDYAAEMMLYRDLAAGIPVGFLSNHTTQTLGSLHIVR